MQKSAVHSLQRRKPDGMAPCSRHRSRARARSADPRGGVIPERVMQLSRGEYCSGSPRRGPGSGGANRAPSRQAFSAGESSQMVLTGLRRSACCAGCSSFPAARGWSRASHPSSRSWRSGWGTKLLLTCTSDRTGGPDGAAAGTRRVGAPVGLLLPARLEEGAEPRHRGAERRVRLESAQEKRLRLARAHGRSGGGGEATGAASSSRTLSKPLDRRVRLPWFSIICRAKRDCPASASLGTTGGVNRMNLLMT